MKLAAAVAVLVALSATAHAQHQHVSGYAGMTARPIKALSDDQIIQLREGRGMGLSLPAELNSYPGPAHVLEMDQLLALTAEQRARLSALQSDMSSQAKALGVRIIAAESRLDAAFAAGTAQQHDILAMLNEIGRLNAELRAVHIVAHMETRVVLRPEQIARYDTERGYTQQQPARPSAPGHRH
jgi:hypothetical protein